MSVICHPLNNHVPKPARDRLSMKWLHLNSNGIEVADGAGGAVSLRVSRVDMATCWSLMLLCSDKRGASALIDAASPCKVGSCKIVPRALKLLDGFPTGVLLEFEHDTPSEVVREATA